MLANNVQSLKLFRRKWR